MEMYIYCGTPEQWHTATAYRADVLPSWMREHLARFPATTVTAYDDEAPVWLPVRVPTIASGLAQGSSSASHPGR